MLAFREEGVGDGRRARRIARFDVEADQARLVGQLDAGLGNLAQGDAERGCGGRPHIRGAEQRLVGHRRAQRRAGEGRGG